MVAKQRHHVLRRGRGGGIIPTPRSLLGSGLLLLLLNLCRRPPVSLALSTPATKVARIEVCQNKDCCRRFQTQSANLPQVVRDLLPPQAAVLVEKTGCLSQCEHGANLLVSLPPAPNKKDDAVVLNLQGVSDHIQAAAQLQVAVGLEIPPKLIAAVTVLEKAHTSRLPQEKETCTSSVIRALSSDERLAGCSAHVRALVMRGEVYLAAGRYQEALQDAQQALEYDASAGVKTPMEGTDTTTTTTTRRAYRVAADAHQGMGNVEEAVQNLQMWAAADPSFRTKIGKEIRQLQQELAPSA